MLGYGYRVLIAGDPLNRLNLLNGPYAAILVTALAYFVAGRLGLWLAIPPGYATAVWPAAGVALTAVLLRGPVVSLGVFLGSFLVNLSIVFDDSSTQTLFHSLVVPACIGAGAALQAFAGAYFIRRNISPKPKLDTLSSITDFVFYAAICSSLINATIGTGTLLAAGIIAPHNYLFNWATWWTGDAIGILIFTVLLLTFFGDEKNVWATRRFTVAIPLSIGFFIIVLSFIAASQWEVSKQQATFTQKAENIQRNLEKAVTGKKEILQYLAALMSSSDVVTREEFARFVSQPLRRDTAIQALEWIPRVSRDDRNRIEQIAREDGLYDFRITEFVDGEIRAAADRPDYFPVYFLEPITGNEKALGLDLGSIPSRRMAIEHAIGSRTFTATESITLVQASGNEKAIILFLPYFSPERPNTAVGLFNVVFRINDLIRSAISDDLIDGVVLTISENAGDAGSTELVSTTALWPDSAVGEKLERFTWNSSLDVGNRSWDVSIVASQKLITASRTLVPWTILAGGLLFTGLLGAFLLYVTGATHRAQIKSEELNGALQELKTTQTQLVESEKLASLGSMMSSLAHELNTPIGIAVTAISALGDRVKSLSSKITGQSDGSSQHEMERFFAMATEAVGITHGNLDRAAQLIRSYKDVAVDRATDEVRTIDLATYLEQILIYLRPRFKRLPHKVTIACPHKIAITTIPGGFSQVMINLLNNSMLHAFKDGQTGEINISVEDRGSDVSVLYTDDGRGIPAADIDKIFEAYYTTRKESGGTGIGLHVVKTIVEKKLLGSVRLSSASGKGVRFEITLPKQRSGS